MQLLWHNLRLEQDSHARTAQELATLKSQLEKGKVMTLRFYPCNDGQQRATILVQHQVDRRMYDWLRYKVGNVRAETMLRDERLARGQDFDWFTFARDPKTDEIVAIHIDEAGQYEQSGWDVYGVDD